MSRSVHLAALILCLGNLGSPTQAAEPPEALLKICGECHGSNGVATKPGVPHLDGQRDVYFADSLKAFAKGARKTAVAQHRSVAHEDIQILATHFAAQKANRSKSPTDPQLTERGQVIYESRCADCHFDAGRDSDKDAPLMAAQNLEYLVAQTLDFKKGIRTFPFMMDDAYRGLSEADLTAVAHFFAAQDQTAPPATGKKRRKRAP